MDILQSPDSLSLLGSMSSFIIYSDFDVVLSLSRSGSSDVILQHTYTPSDSGKVEIDLKSVIRPLLSFHLFDYSYAYQQADIAAAFDVTVCDVPTDTTAVTTKEVSFTVVRAGVDRFADSATNFLTQNFLTWQPNMKAVTYYSPEFLTYYAPVAATVKCTAYFTDANPQTLALASIPAGTAWTVPVQYSIIAGKTSALPSYYDVWAENASGTRLTYIQRYYASAQKSEEEEWVLFENSLGGVDTFRAYGDSENTAEHTHNVAEIEDDSEEYRVDTTRKFKKNTGYLDKRERLWMLDFFPSLGKYIYASSSVRRIVVTDSDVSYKAKELPSSYNFTYKYADARPYLNLNRTEETLTQIDISIPDIGSFTIAPRLVEFPRLTLSDGALLPVQNPYSENWAVTTVAAIFDYVVGQITANYSGNGGIGHSHSNLPLLQGLSLLQNYLLVNGTKINAALADQATNLTPASSDWAKIAQKIKDAMLNLSDIYLSKTDDDKAAGLITFLKGIAFGDGGFGITALGAAILNSLQSANFNTNEQTGFGLVRKDDSGHYRLSITDLMVWGRAVFNTLEIRELTYVGGNYIFSPAGGTLFSVTEMDDVYRCYILADDGSASVENKWKVGDQALCETFNIKAEVYENVANKRYWRLVTDVSDVNEMSTVSGQTGDLYWDSVDDDHLVYLDGAVVSWADAKAFVDGKKFMWVDLSKSLCEDGSGVPAAGDKMACLGSQSETARQAAFEILAYGDEAPCAKWYANISDFTLQGCCPISISPSAFNVDSTVFNLRTTTGVKVEIPHYRGNWINITADTDGNRLCAYNDEVTHDGQLWRCIVSIGETTDEPSTTSDNWELLVSKGADGVTVSSTVTKYVVTANALRPEDTAFTLDNMPSPVSEGSYIWSMTIVTYSDGSSTKTYGCSYIGKNGEKGKSGAYSVYMYAISAYDVPSYAGGPPADVESADWSTAPVAVTDAKPYLWVSITPYDSDGNKGTTTFVRMTGAGGDPGNPGEDAWAVSLVPNTVIFQQATDGSINYGIDANNALPTVYKGETQRINDTLTIIESVNCTAEVDVSTSDFSTKSLKIKTILADDDGKYYDTGYVKVLCGVSGVHVEYVKFVFALNKLGEFYTNILADVKTECASKTDFDTFKSDTDNNLALIKTDYKNLITTSSEGLEGKISKVKTVVDGNTTDIAANKTDITNIKATAEGLAATISTTQNTAEGNSTDIATLKATATQISLKLDTQTNKNNLLTGTAFRKQEEFEWNGRVNSSKERMIVKNAGYGGTNAVYINSTDSTNYYYRGVIWRNIAAKYGVNTLSVIVKSPDITSFNNSPSNSYAAFEVREYFYDNDGNMVFTRPDWAEKSDVVLTPSANNTWELKTARFTVGDVVYVSGMSVSWEKADNYTASDHLTSGKSYLTDHIMIIIWVERNGKLYICRPMLMLGDTYSGWSMSQQDYDYIGGNMLANSRTLTDPSGGNAIPYKLDTAKTADDGGSNYVSNTFTAAEVTTATSSTSVQYKDVLNWSGQLILEAGQDYTFSAYVKGSGYLCLHLYYGSLTVVDASETCDGVSRTDGDGFTYIKLTSEWRRVWIKWHTNSGIDTTNKYNFVAIRQYYKSDDAEVWQNTLTQTVYMKQPKFEKGATMTDYLESGDDMVSKAQLLATGIDIAQKKVIVTANQFIVRNNSGDVTASVNENSQLEVTDGLFRGTVKAKVLYHNVLNVPCPTDEGTTIEIGDADIVVFRYADWGTSTYNIKIPRPADVKGKVLTFINDALMNGTTNSPSIYIITYDDSQNDFYILGGTSNEYITMSKNCVVRIVSSPVTKEGSAYEWMVYERTTIS